METMITSNTSRVTALMQELDLVDDEMAGLHAALSAAKAALKNNTASHDLSACQALKSAISRLEKIKIMLLHRLRSALSQSQHPHQAPHASQATPPPPRKAVAKSKKLIKKPYIRIRSEAPALKPPQITALKGEHPLSPLLQSLTDAAYKREGIARPPG
ncbi:MAG: hypothetical protein M3Q97_10025 [Bacteroidota bacterium]|nr:hypothetical protein [Bacteroidota bacterium]